MSDLVQMLRTPIGCDPPTKWELQAANRIEALQGQIQVMQQALIEQSDRINDMRAALGKIAASEYMPSEKLSDIALAALATIPEDGNAGGPRS